MPVTEAHQGIGGWRLRIRGGADANEIVARINQWDHVYIVPSGLADTPDLNTLKQTAIFAGRVDQMDADGSGIEVGGPSLAVWLGDEQGNGPMPTTNATATQSLADWLNAVAIANRLTEAGLAWGVFNHFPTATIAWTRERLKTVRQYLGELQDLVSIPFEWLVNPNGTVDVEGWSNSPDLRDTLFAYYPYVMVSDVLSRATGVSFYSDLERSLQVFPGEINVTWDFSRWASQAYTLGNNTPATLRDNDQKVNYPGIVGNNPALAQVRWNTAVSAQTDVNGQLDALAKITNQYASIRREWDVEAASAEIRFHVKAGDYIWLHAENLPGIGSLTYAQEQSEWAGVDAATNPAVAQFPDAASVAVAGRPIYPVRARVSSIDWPVVDNLFDVYLANTWDGTGNITLLNPFLEWDPDGGVRLDCNANRPQWQLLVPTAETFAGRVRETQANRRAARTP